MLDEEGFQYCGRPAKRKQRESRWVMTTHVNVKSLQRNHNNNQTNRSILKILHDSAVLGTPEKRPKRTTHVSYVNIYCILPFLSTSNTRNKKEQLRFSSSNQNASFALHLPAPRQATLPSVNQCAAFWFNVFGETKAI